MNIVYTRRALSEVTGTPIPELKNEDVMKMKDVLTTVFNAGREDALHYPVQRGMRRQLEGDAETTYTIWSFEALDIHVLEAAASDTDVDYIPIRFDNTYDARGERRYVLGSAWNTLDAAVVEALSMKMDYNNAVGGQYANRVLGFD